MLIPQTDCISVHILCMYLCFIHKKREIFSGFSRINFISWDWFCPIENAWHKVWNSLNECFLCKRATVGSFHQCLAMRPNPSSACFNSSPTAPSGMSNRPFALASTWVPRSVLGWTRPLFWPPWALNSYNIDLCGINWLPLTASPPFLREDPVEFPLPPGANPWHSRFWTWCDFSHTNSLLVNLLSS